jgi:DNA/RNA endonuclease YhcR with UshA esterase domain
VGKAYPDSTRFTVLIWGENRGKFPAPPEQMYRGKTVCVSGLVTTYQGVGEIEVASPSAIVVQ